MTNFDFLKKIDANLYEIIKEAEKLYTAEFFEQCMGQTRRFGEQMCKSILADRRQYDGSFDDMSFEGFYESMINDIANTGKVYKSMSENEETLASQLDSQRLQVMGVASDEELSNMIRYQQAYNASSRYVNVIDSMLETLINNLGVR